MAEIKEQTVEGFLEELASKSPAPGSGSAVAVVAAKAAALVAKVCRLTIGKSEYVEVESEMLRILGYSDALRAALLFYAEADRRSFSKCSPARVRRPVCGKQLLR